MSSEDSVAFLQAAAGGLAPGQAPPVQIGACRAIVQLSQRTTGASLQPHLRHIYSGQLYTCNLHRASMAPLTLSSKVSHRSVQQNHWPYLEKVLTYACHGRSDQCQECACKQHTLGMLEDFATAGAEPPLGYHW